MKTIEIDGFEVDVKERRTKKKKRSNSPQYIPGLIHNKVRSGEHRKKRRIKRYAQHPANHLTFNEIFEWILWLCRGIEESPKVDWFYYSIMDDYKDKEYLSGPEVCREKIQDAWNYGFVEEEDIRQFLYLKYHQYIRMRGFVSKEGTEKDFLAGEQWTDTKCVVRNPYLMKFFGFEAIRYFRDYHIIKRVREKEWIEGEVSEARSKEEYCWTEDPYPTGIGILTDKWREASKSFNERYLLILRSTQT